jgi:hypothetical protein
MNPQPFVSIMNTNITAAALRRAAAIRDQIEKLQAQVTSILSGTAPRRGRKPGRVAKKAASAKPRKRRKLSPEARARIVAAVKARWAREKAGK